MHSPGFGHVPTGGGGGGGGGSLTQRAARPGPAASLHSKPGQHHWLPSQGCPSPRHLGCAAAKRAGSTEARAVAAKSFSAWRRERAPVARPRASSSKESFLV